MALTLPTFTVTDPAKEARLLAAFKETPASTNAEAAVEYKAWLKAALLVEVQQREQQKAIRQALTSLENPGSLLEP